MTLAQDTPESAKSAYEAFATDYDDFTHAYRNDQWTGRLLGKAKGIGLRGDRLLDVGCGTGKSFIPMIDRGWRVTACDISPAMVELAKAKIGDQVELSVADMRELPALGEFDLVWALDDAVNYLLSLEELEAALSGMRRNLAPTGVLVFDLNTLLTYRTFFSSEHVVERHGRRLVWKGQTSPGGVEPGCIGQASFEVEGGAARPHVHRQRHFGVAEVLPEIDAAGLDCREILGELDGDLYDSLDEAAHTKAVYLCVGAESSGAPLKSEL